MNTTDTYMHRHVGSYCEQAGLSSLRCSPGWCLPRERASPLRPEILVASVRRCTLQELCVRLWGVVLTSLSARPTLPHRMGAMLAPYGPQPSIFWMCAVTCLRVYTICIEQAPGLPVCQDCERVPGPLSYFLGGSPRLQQHKSCTLCSRRCRIDSCWGT